MWFVCMKVVQLFRFANTSDSVAILIRAYMHDSGSSIQLVEG